MPINIGLDMVHLMIITKVELIAKLSACESGWRSEYVDDTGNQAYHFWWLAEVAYFDGYAVALAANKVHESIHEGSSQKDLDLGIKGAILGLELSRYNQYTLLSDEACPSAYDFILSMLKKTSPTEVPLWIKNRLAE